MEDYTGKEVYHKAKFGKGIIVKQGKDYVCVQFENEPKTRMFQAPSCFDGILKLTDQEASEKAQRESENQKAAKKEREEKSIRESRVETQIRLHTRKNSAASDRMQTQQTYASVGAFCAAQKGFLNEEINYLKDNGGKRTRILDGQMVEQREGTFIYTFECESELNYPDNTQITLWIPGISEGIKALILNADEFTLIISTKIKLADHISQAEFTADPIVLLQTLINRLEDVEKEPSIAEELICEGGKQIRPGERILTGQERAIQMSYSQPITFIWGPPGTGKTETLAKIALQHMQRGEKVLMVSYSNVSVDGAAWRVFHKDEEKRPGKIVRYGYPRDKQLLKHEYLSTYNLTIMNHPELLAERDRLIEKRRNTPRSSQEYVKMGERLTEIRNELRNEEKKAVMDAAFVATTVSKAVIDKTLYEQKYDTVIFDEASMAYIPQIVFSARLAREHFICMGDYRQLPPIVQSSVTNGLNEDIFQFAGIEEAVENGDGHGWLCLLDTQYRMHPEIADFSSCYMYKNLLKSAEGMEEKRQDIAEAAPFSYSAMGLANLSGMYSVCRKTADGSRINVLSAMISMGLAAKAAEKNEVGIISPYSAQARLLHSMVRDASENMMERKKISCATVHQFQGSEKAVILYDAVDCYRMPYPGVLLTASRNQYANRLFNVALTRARGKIISVVNVDYMRQAKLSHNLIFRNMIELLDGSKAAKSGNALIDEMSSSFIKVYDQQKAASDFLADLQKVQKGIHMDIPGGTVGSSVFFEKLFGVLSEARKSGVRLVIRTDDKSRIPEKLRSLVIENSFLSDPVTLIDKKTVWYGMPPSMTYFRDEAGMSSERVFPVFRYEGKYFATALYGFLNMNETIDTPMVSSQSETANNDGYSTFAAYVAAKCKCDKCGSAMKLQKNRSNGGFFLGCSNYPACRNPKSITTEMIEKYFSLCGPHGKTCPRDGYSLEAKKGQYGVYVCCCGGGKHTYKLDEV